MEGIFKPKDSKYSLTIWSRSAAGADLEIYPDEFPGIASWWRAIGVFGQKWASGFSHQLLSVCLHGRQTAPPGDCDLARERTSRRSSLQAARPALLTGYDATTRRFQVTGSTPAVIQPLSDIGSPIQVEESYLRSGLILPMSLAEERTRYITTREARDQAFRQMVLGEYDGSVVCAGQCSFSDSKTLPFAKPRPRTSFPFTERAGRYSQCAFAVQETSLGIRCRPFYDFGC